MCGINLILDKNNNLDQKPIQAMNQAIIHRGPDTSKYKSLILKHSTLYLGANRLAITDPKSTEHQPLSSHNQNHHLCFNGEIYNQQDLRKKSKHTFRSNTDTETLLAGLESNGLQILTETNGMYAFIYVNSSNESIYFGRDPHGIKPLYYYEDDHYLIISSEIKGIIASGLVEKKFNANALQHYLQYRYTQAPYTFYQNIVEVKHGQYFKWTEFELTNHTIHYQGHHTFDRQENVVNTTIDLLRKSIKRQLPQYTEAGLFLSGGTDSTLLLALLRDLGVNNLPIFTVGNTLKSNQHGSQDFAYAQKAAKLYNYSLNPIEVSEQFLQTFPEYIASIDQPIADNAGWLTWILSKQSVNACKVAFSGAGADELFAGYNRHVAFEKYLKIVPYNISGLRKLAFFPESKTLPFRNTFRLVNKLASSIDKSPEKTWTNFITFSSFNNLQKDKIEVKFNASTDLLKQALQHDLHNYLPYDVLKISDISSMASGQEVRVPFLDLELSHYTQSIPADVLLKHGKKWILKTILTQLNGDQFASRTKSGFGLPLNSWLQGKYGDTLLHYIRDKSNPIFQFIEYEFVNQLIEQHFNNKKDLSGELYAMITLAAWIKKEFV